MLSQGGRSTGTSVLALALCAWSASTLTACTYADVCWEVYACAPDPEPPPGPCEGQPGTAPALDQCGVFVSERGDDNSPGTKGAPVRTLQHAVGLAASGRGNGEAPTRRVYACGGAFEEAITLPAGVDLWGARLCNGGEWSYGGSFGGPDELTTIAPPAGIPLRVLAAEEDATDATSMIFGVRVVAAHASARDGKSSVAVILSPGARAIVRSSKVQAESGKDGEAGEDAPVDRASDGAPGNDGADACTADVVKGARPAVTVCGDGTESTGGYGGDGRMDVGGDGTAGQPAPAENPEGKGFGGAGAASERCKPGEDGAKGDDGGRAAGAAGVGYLDVDGWIGVRGEDGKKGGIGQGGGGGGGSKSRGPMVACRAGEPQGGAAGGSGGGGGCGGLGGKGGGYGGASIGIVALQGSVLTIEDSEVLAGNGGRGGVGGTGQLGGVGRSGAAGGEGYAGTDMWHACMGGNGGDGGRGGDAGGGLGGHSLGIASVAATVTLTLDAIVTHRSGGEGGLAGNATSENDEGNGAQGVARFWYRFDAPEPEVPQ
ncbi:MULTISPECIES: hypothetical protein [Sorangium]|uniref:PGRS family protein n=1 Tax=Sorangium cellulosum TaxID=56 RepID=A0A4P2QY71_SORCE|nr:hypothetical protein [Sorangium cellulosum]AUX35520.1 hypothetical protein SOCE836_077140 [Sorangium cellulosum]WCQ94821.1 hypothetical protein NQZ70_07592 [Sorangium sp. Soce836]